MNNIHSIAEEKCYECEPGAFGDFRPWMMNTLCNKHREKHEGWAKKTAEAMVAKAPLSKDPLQGNYTSVGSLEFHVLGLDIKP